MPVNSKRSKKVNNSNNLPEVEVTAAAPSWLKYEHQFLKTFPKSERIQQYLTPMARSLGNSASAYPERIDKQYEADKNDFVARMIMLDRNNDKFTDKEKRHPDTGSVALQVHGGGDYTNQFVRYRNVRIKEWK